MLNALLRTFIGGLKTLGCLACPVVIFISSNVSALNCFSQMTFIEYYLLLLLSFSHIKVGNVSPICCIISYNVPFYNEVSEGGAINFCCTLAERRRDNSGCPS